MLLRVYTQNIDGLETAAGVSDKKMVYAHGSLKWAKCMRCGKKKSALRNEHRRRVAIAKVQEEVRENNKRRFRKHSPTSADVVTLRHAAPVKVELPSAQLIPRRKPAVPRLSGRSMGKTNTRSITPSPVKKQETRKESVPRFDFVKKTTNISQTSSIVEDSKEDEGKQTELRKRRTEAREYMMKQRQQRVKFEMEKRAALERAEEKRKLQLEVCVR